jgi:hypothetical protein
MPLSETEAKSAPLACETRQLGSPQRTKFVDYTAKRVVRGGVEPPTFRFSGVADTQIQGRCHSVADCRRVPMVGAGCRRCRHRCRQLAGHPMARGDLRPAVTRVTCGSTRRNQTPAAPSPAVPVAKLSCPPHCLQRELPAARSMKVGGTGAVRSSIGRMRSTRRQDGRRAARTGRVTAVVDELPNRFH